MKHLLSNRKKRIIKKMKILSEDKAKLPGAVEEGKNPPEGVDDVEEEDDTKWDDEEGGDLRDDVDEGANDQAGAGRLHTECAAHYYSTLLIQCAVKVL